MAETAQQFYEVYGYAYLTSPRVTLGVMGSNFSPPCSLQCIWHCIHLLIVGAPRPLLPPPSPKSRFGEVSSAQGHRVNYVACRRRVSPWTALR